MELHRHEAKEEMQNSLNEGIERNRAMLLCLSEENRKICTDRMNEIEKEYREKKCRLEEEEAKIKDLCGKAKKFVVGSVAVVAVVAGWWFFS